MKLINLNETVYSDIKPIEIAKEKITLNNGKELDVNVTAHLELDECYQLEDMEDLWYSETEYKELERKLESGQISPYVIVVTANYKNHSESSYLSGVLTEKAETVKEMNDNYDLVSMVTEAIDDLKNLLNDILGDLT